MALNLYSGRPGAGKSYNIVANVIIPALKKGRHVVTNIPLNAELLTQVYGGSITQLPLDCLDDPELPQHIPNGCVAVIDECWNRWPSGQKVSQAPKNDLHWLKEHRHRVDKHGNSMQVVLATQDPSDLASWVRKLIAHMFYMEKLDSLGMENAYTVKIYRGCHTGDNIPKRHLLRTTQGTYDPDIYQYYSSATQSENNDVGNETVIDRRTSIWSSPVIWLQLIGAPIVFVASAYFLFTTVAGITKKDESESSVSSVEPSVEPLPVLVNPPPPPETLPVEPPQPVTIPKATPSSTWRVAGYIRPSAQPANAPWSSVAGYGSSSDVHRHTVEKPLAILVSLSGTRYVPLSECEPYSDGINYSCDIDGERVTPWSGASGLTDSFPSTAASRARDVVFERSENTTSRAPETQSASATTASLRVYGVSSPD